MEELRVIGFYVQALVHQRRAPARRGEDGVTTIEYVILGAIVAAGVIAIGTLIVAKFTGKAETIPTG